MNGSVDGVGCLKARSGFSPEASLVGKFDSYGSGTTTVFTVAPVAFSKAAMTCLGSPTLFCAVQKVSVTPLSEAVGLSETEPAPAPEPEAAGAAPPPPGSEHADAASASA